MRIDRAYKGALRNSIQLFDDGMCDGPLLEVGQQYLMYTSGDPTKPVPSRGCTRSRSIKYAKEDLEFLEAYSKGTATPWVGGTIRSRPSEPENGKQDESHELPLKGVSVTLSGDSKDVETTTDATGSYRFSDVRPGSYKLDAKLTGYRLSSEQDDFDLASHGCIQADLWMNIDRRVQGIVRDHRGLPAASVRVEMVPSNTQLERWKQPILLAESDEEGRYIIDDIPPGEYYLGINIKSTPTKEHPFSPTYYPNTQERSQATPIIAGSAASVQEFDLQAPGKLPLVTIHGKIKRADGKPPSIEDHPHVRIKEPRLYGQIEQDDIPIDAEGNFQFVLCEGVPYSAFAFSGTIRNQVYSAPVEFVPTKERDRLELILNKTPEEFRRLRPK